MKEENEEIRILKEEVLKKQRITNAVYEKIKSCTLSFLLNSNLSKEDSDLFKKTFKDFFNTFSI